MHAHLVANALTSSSLPAINEDLISAALISPIASATNTVDVSKP